MEQVAAAPASRPGFFTWRTMLVIAALAAAAWWVWRESPRKKPAVALQSNVTPPPPAPPGVPMTLTTKMAQAVDTQIPVVMTSGSVVQHDDDEIRSIVRKVLSRLNDMGEAITLLQIASAAKTQDSYKTVSYEIVAQVFDSRENVGMSIVIHALVPLSGQLYVRTLRLQNTPDDGKGPAGVEGRGAGLAAYEDPVAVLKKFKI